MPRTGHAAVDDPPFAQRPVLVGAVVRNGAERSLISENRHPVARRQADDPGEAFADLANFADPLPRGLIGKPVAMLHLMSPGGHMQARDAQRQRPGDVRKRHVLKILPDAKGDVGDDRDIGWVNEVMQRLPDARRQELQPEIMGRRRQHAKAEQREDAKYLEREPQNLIV